MIIRYAKVEDAKDIAGICISAFHYQSNETLVRTRIENLDEKKEQIYVAEADNVVVGFVHAAKYQQLFIEDCINIMSLAVNASYQKQGIGEALLKRVEEWAIRENHLIIRLNSGVERVDAHSFYRHLGYVNDKDQKRFIKHLKKD